MPDTPVFGLPFEKPSDLPGISITGGPSGTHDILAVIVEQLVQEQIAGLQNEIDSFGQQGTYTPTLTASGGNPDVGADGFINGRWHRSGQLITAWGDTLFSGSGADLGGSSWRVSLPFNADLSFHSAGTQASESDCVGMAKFLSPGQGSQSPFASALLSAAAELIFYGDQETGSMGSGDLSGNVRLKWTVQYVIDPSELT